MDELPCKSLKKIRNLLWNETSRTPRDDLNDPPIPSRHVSLPSSGRASALSQLDSTLSNKIITPLKGMNEASAWN